MAIAEQANIDLRDLQTLSSWIILDPDAPFQRILCTDQGISIPLTNREYVRQLREIRRVNPERYYELKKVRTLVEALLIETTVDEKGRANSLTEAVTRISDAVSDENRRKLYEQQFNNIIVQRYIDPFSDKPISDCNLIPKMATATATADELREQMRDLLEDLTDQDAVKEAMQKVKENHHNFGHKYEGKPRKLAELLGIIIQWSEYQNAPKAARTLYQALEAACNQRYTPKARIEATYKLVASDESMRDGMNALACAGILYEVTRAIDLGNVWVADQYADELSPKTFYAVHDKKTGKAVSWSYSKKDLYCPNDSVIIEHHSPARTQLFDQPKSTEASGRVKYRWSGTAKSAAKDGKPNRDYEGLKHIIPEDADMPQAVSAVLRAVMQRYPNAKILKGPDVDKSYGYQQNIIPEGFTITLNDGNTIEMEFSNNGHNQYASEARKAVKFYLEIEGRVVEMQFQTMLGHLNSTYAYDRNHKPDFHDGYWVDKMMSPKVRARLFGPDYLAVVQEEANIPIKRRLSDASDYLAKLLVEIAHQRQWGKALQRKVKN